MQPCCKWLSDLFFSVSFTHYSVFAKFPKIVCLLKDTPHYFQNTHYNTPGGGRRDRGGQRPPSARNWRPKAANLLWIMAAEGRHDICLDAVSVKRQRGNAAFVFAIVPKLTTDNIKDTTREYKNVAVATDKSAYI